MVKIGAKIVKNHKTVKTVEYINVNEYSSNDFFEYVSNICHRLDIATPVIIDYHKKCFEEFNSLKLTKDDFIDKIDFDFLYLENDDL